MKVLVVDDNRAVLAVTIQFLKTHKLDATGVESAEQALLTCRQSEIEVVVTDCLMPGISGLELADELRSLDQPPRLILTTGLELPPEDETAARERFDEVLVKPFRLDNLLAAILATQKRSEQ